MTESSAKFPTATSNAATATATAHVGKKPEKPTLLAHPSESTLRAPTSSGSQTPSLVRARHPLQHPISMIQLNMHLEFPDHLIIGLLLRDKAVVLNEKVLFLNSRTCLSRGHITGLKERWRRNIKLNIANSNFVGAYDSQKCFT